MSQISKNAGQSSYTRNLLTKNKPTQNKDAVFVDDIGGKHKILIRNLEGIGYSTITTIDFSSDILEYLIRNKKFNISTIRSPKPYFVLSVNDPNLPLIEYNNFIPYTSINNKLIVSINIKNLFDSVDFFDRTQSFKTLLVQNPNISPLKKVSLKDKYNNSGASADSDEEVVSRTDYNEYIERIREHYKVIYSNAEIKKKIAITENDRTEYNGIIIPCESNYNLETQHIAINESITKDDFMNYELLKSNKYILDLIYRHYNNKIPDELLETSFFDKNGNIKENVILESVPIPDNGGDNKEFLIIGVPSTKFHVCNTVFSETLENYDQIINDQRENYEKWIKEYTFQELSGRKDFEAIKAEYAQMGKKLDSVADVQLSDYILNKKKIADVDFNYIKEKHLLTDDELIQMKKYLHHKLNNFLENKFNYPNKSLIYLWKIKEITYKNVIDPANPKNMNKEILNVENAINYFREINELHTNVLEKIKELSFTKMLFKHKITTEDDEEYKQVFTDYACTDIFELRSFYIHPLNYKIRYNSDNKLFTIEELIEYSKLTCDGLSPSMKKYKGLPFCAVLPIEVTSFNKIVNSSFYLKHIKCNNIYDEYDEYDESSESAESAESAESVESAESNGITKKQKPSLRPKNITTMKNSNRANVAKQSPNPADIIDHTILIPKDKDKDKINLKQIFSNPDIRVISTLITGNGVLNCVFYDTSINKFYYVLLEINIKYLYDNYFETLRKYKSGKYKSGNTKKSKDALEKLITENNAKYFQSIKNLGGIDIMGVKQSGDDRFPYKLINILVVKEFTSGDNVFTILGNECVYKMYSNMDDFFKKDKIELLDGIQIDNPYKYVLISLINKLVSIKPFLEDKLENESPGIKKYYRVKQSRGMGMGARESNTSNSKESIYMEESELDANPEIDLELKVDKRIESKQIQIDIPFPNNTCFITIGSKYILFMNKYYEDLPISNYVSKIKQQMANSFKFTTWVITKEYAKQCIAIINQIASGNKSNEDLYEISETVKQNVLFNITSLKGSDNIEELNEHIKNHSKFMKRFVISNDTYLCKSYVPHIQFTGSSDIISTILHIHFLQNIIHTLALKYINLKYELLSNKISIYDTITYELSVFMFNNNINKTIVNKDVLFNKNINNPYFPALKLSSLLTMEFII